MRRDIFTALDNFCDEVGDVNTEFPSNQWKNTFTAQGNGTRVETEITYNSIEDMQKMMDMGFEEGFAIAHGNLDELLTTLSY